MLRPPRIGHVRAVASWAAALAWVWLALFVRVAPLPSQMRATPIQILNPSDRTVSLIQTTRIGTESGPDDSFGRITDVLVDGAGRIFVADLSESHVAVFDPTGQRIGTLGRQGSGPGEFQSPWTLARGRGDTIFVVDLALARVSVFAQDLSFVRSFRVNPSWAIGFLAELADGTLLVTGYGGTKGGYVHRLARDGALLESAPFDPTSSYTGPPLYGYETSLLGGTLVVEGNGYVYANRSPYEVTFLSRDWTVRRACRGEAGWTTPPAEVVRRTGNTVALNWNQYTHVVRILSLTAGRYLVVTRDPRQDRTVIDLLDRDCRIHSRTELPGSISLFRTAGRQVVGLVEVDYPEVVIYDVVER